jgi:hypothetical protein
MPPVREAAFSPTVVGLGVWISWTQVVSGLSDSELGYYYVLHTLQGHGDAIQCVTAAPEVQLFEL